MFLRFGARISNYSVRKYKFLENPKNGLTLFGYSRKNRNLRRKKAENNFWCPKSTKKFRWVIFETERKTEKNSRALKNRAFVQKYANNSEI